MFDDVDDFEIIKMDKKEGFAILKHNKTGEEKKMKFMDPDKMEEMRKALISGIANRIKEDDLKLLMFKAERFLAAPVTITEYEFIITDLVDRLKVIYNGIDKQNIFKSYIKNLDPKCYGKAQTCIPIIVRLSKTLNGIAEYKNLKFNITVPEED